MNTKTDSVTTIAQLRDEAQKFVTERDWGKYHSPKNLVMSIAIEAAELMEVYQWVSNPEADRAQKNERRLERVKEELADVILYCLNLANAVDIDIAEAVRTKIVKNAQKYPVDRANG